VEGRAPRAAGGGHLAAEGDFLTIDGHRVHYVVMGEGPDVVLVHGASGNTRDFTHALAGRLAERYRVIVMDRPGLGYTDRIDPQGASLAAQAGLLADAAAELGAERPIVFGHSYGGAVALAWALQRPDRSRASCFPRRRRTLGTRVSGPTTPSSPIRWASGS
jgi:pimeloyl-ACP methyl ester carboxylesterase